MPERLLPLPEPLPPVLAAALQAKLDTCLDPAIRARLSPGEPPALAVSWPEGWEADAVAAQVEAIAQGVLRSARFFAGYHPEVLHAHQVPLPRPTPDLMAVLAARGDIAPLGGGLLAYGGHFLAVATRMDAAFSALAAADGAAPWDLPDLLPLVDAERTGYVDGFLDHATFALGVRRDIFAMEALLDRSERGPADFRAVLADPRHVLRPAACHPLFAAWRGRELATDVTVTTRARCFRNEAAPEPDLRRLWNFTVREVVRFGLPESLDTWRRRWVDRVFGLARAWGLACRVEAAHDPFFARDHGARALRQRAGRLKYELLGEMPGAEPLALSSFNLHGDHFCGPFAITREGRPLHSACLGFGLERWAACFLAQQGPDAMPGAVDPGL